MPVSEFSLEAPK